MDYEPVQPRQAIYGLHFDSPMVSDRGEKPYWMITKPVRDEAREILEVWATLAGIFLALALAFSLLPAIDVVGGLLALFGLGMFLSLGCLANDIATANANRCRCN